MIVPVRIDNHCVGVGANTENYNSAAFVQISTLTVLFNQK